MALQDYLARLDKLITLTDTVSQELVAWSEPDKRASLLERIAREAGEGSQELLAPLLDGSWRTPPEEVDRRIQHLLAGQSLSRFGTDAFGFAPESLRPVLPLLEFLPVQAEKLRNSGAASRPAPCRGHTRLRRWSV